MASQIDLKVTKILRIFLKKFCEYGPWFLVPTVSFMDFNQGREMIILELILTTFEASSICWGSSKKLARA